jgi:hypothetical protein
MKKSNLYTAAVLVSLLLSGNAQAGAFNDFDGDGKSDLAIYQPSVGKWVIRTLDARALAWFIEWGYPGCMPVPADYDGDGKTDMGIYDEGRGVWFIRTLNPVRALLWNHKLGGPGFVPVPGDYNGDGKADIGVYELATGNWTVRSLTDFSLIYSNANWGFKGPVRGWERPITSTVLPMPFDYDRDGKMDRAVYYRGLSMTDTAWFILGSSGKWWYNTVWGSSGSLPAPGMYRNVVDEPTYPAGITIYKVKYSVDSRGRGDGTDGTFNTPYMFQFKLGTYPRCLAVAGHDFDGNGWDDHATYDYLNGNWTISFNDADGNGNQMGNAYQQPPRQVINWGFNGAVPADIYSTIYAACKYTYKPW